MDKQELRERVERLIGQGSRVNQTGEVPDDWYVFILAGDVDDVIALFEAVGLLDEEEAKADPEYRAIVEQMAQDAVEGGYGITKEAFAAMPKWYVGHCEKCDKRTVLNKGSLLDYGVYGIYECKSCKYPYPPGKAPAVIEV